MNVAVRRPASSERAVGIAVFALPQPYLLFLGDVVEAGFAKTAFGLRDWAGERCVGEFALPGARVSTGLPALDPKAAVARGARSMVIGVANAGGQIPASWLGALLEALEAGLDLVSGMHVRLADLPGLQAAADKHGRRLLDVRTPPGAIPIGSGVKRSGRRLLTVGTDCALGKKYTALAIARSLKARGVDATFRATGQTGIMIAGEGMPMDSVVADFVAGAAEILSPDAATDHVDVIEGQGSLFHPSYAGVALGLLHGSQPDRFVVCHEPGRTHLLGHPEFALPSIEQVIAQTVALGRVTNPDIRCAGISLNTARLAAAEAQREIARVEKRLTLPVADPMRGGPSFERLLDACMS
jgi:D-glutamate N-acetyltransferase